MVDFAKFQVVAGDECWIVRKAARCLSMSDVPRDFTWQFEKRSMAVEQVRRLEKLQRHYGQEVELLCIGTDDAFEQRADALYGPDGD